jgi:hypothetical protein
MHAADTLRKAAGDVPDQSDKNDRTKKPLETVMWAKMKPLSHGMNDVIDTWERLAKYVPLSARHMSAMTMSLTIY